MREQGLDCEFAALGTMNVYRDARGFERARIEHERLAEHLPRCDVLDGAAAIAREPALKPGVAGAFFNPGDAQLRPDRYVDELARIVRARGGVIEENAKIEHIVRDRGRIARVATSRGDFSAGEVVLALGAWSPRFARELGLRVPIQPGKGYSITYTRPANCPRIPLTLKEPSVCVTAWGSGYRLGSTMEFSGYDATLNRARLDTLRRGAARFLHEPEGPAVVEEWYGWRPMTPDDLPLIGRVPHIENLVLATGHGMLGVTMSAGTGLLVSEVVTNVVVHAGTSGEAVLVELPHGVRIAVTDTGRQLPDRRDPTPAEPDGRGLGIVAMLSRQWGVEVEDATKTVWFELHGTPEASSSTG